MGRRTEGFGLDTFVRDDFLYGEPQSMLDTRFDDDDVVKTS